MLISDEWETQFFSFSSDCVCRSDAPDPHDTLSVYRSRLAVSTLGCSPPCCLSGGSGSKVKVTLRFPPIQGIRGVLLVEQPFGFVS